MFSQQQQKIYTYALICTARAYRDFFIRCRLRRFHRQDFKAFGSIQNARETSALSQRIAVENAWENLFE